MQIHPMHIVHGIRSMPLIRMEKIDFAIFLDQILPKITLLVKNASIFLAHFKKIYYLCADFFLKV